MITACGEIWGTPWRSCPDTGKRYDIFGTGGAKRRAEAMNIPFLGEVPINIQMRVHGDEGTTAANFDDPKIAEPLETICYRLVKNISQQHEQEPPLPSLSVL